MAWSWPPSWAVGKLVTAAELNTYVRDNLAEAGPAVVTTAGDLLVGNAANDLKRLAIGNANDILKVSGSAVAWAAAATQSIWVAVTTLTDTAMGAGATQWGTEEAVVANPSESVNIMAWVSGYSGTGTVNLRVYVQISTDGGSTWSSGLYEDLDNDTSWNINLSGFHCVEATVPTGEIQARVYGQGSATFYDGFLVLLVQEVA